MCVCVYPLRAQAWPCKFAGQGIAGQRLLVMWAHSCC